MPTPQQIQEAISQVRNQQTFLNGLLHNTLGWPVPDGAEQIEDIAYEWSLTELNADGLNERIVNGRIYQIKLTDGQPWGIFLLEFANDDIFRSGYGLTSPLRKVLRGLVPKPWGGHSNLPSWDSEHLLFICSNRRYQHFRFAYFKAPKEKGHAEPLTTFGWEDGNIPRTTCEFNLSHLVWPREPENAERWISEWAQAFDVETVTNRFYEDYKQVFENLQRRLNLPTDDDKKMFAQVLMNRLMFLRFVERKNWLRLGDSNPKEYLKNLYHAGPLNNLSWYRSRLQVLFFEGLAIPNHNREHIIGSVPYLNGGLFTVTPWDERAGDIPNDAFEPILGEHGLLYSYNFTVEESTPLDIEVAVDPEMLGKVFEKLVTDRRNQGSYYTPRTVVSFMCREALKGYLGSQYDPLIDEGKTDTITVSEARDLLSKLDSVKIVDPACGSGAYLLGMLQELFTLSEKLDTRAQTTDPHTAYQRKLQIICNNIYGVDLDDFAVSIARLRLWLSLAVDFDGDCPDPLPNLDFKIEDGDSLTAPDPSAAGQLDFFRQERIRQFDQLKAAYMNPVTRAQQPNLYTQIMELRAEIASFSHPRQQVRGFDWRVEFAEVWSQKNGFDIVIANPPYGATVEEYVRDMYFNHRSEHERGQSKDTYGLFMARGLQLLRPGGIMSYIVSDTWRTIKSHRPLRKRLLDTTTVFHVIDLPAWIFDATVNTGIVTLQKQIALPEHKLIAADLRGIENGNWKALSDNLIAISGHGPDIQTLTCARYTYAQSLISSYENLSFFVGSPQLYTIMSDSRFVKLGTIADVKVGLQTGDNEYYIRKRQGARGGYQILDENLLLTEEEIAGLSEEEKQNGIDPDDYDGRCFVPYDKGGASDTEEGWLPNYYVPTQYFIDWSKDAVRKLKNDPRARFQNSQFYFKPGITFSYTGFYAPNFRLNSCSVFDVGGSSCFNLTLPIPTSLAFLTSKVNRYIAKVFIDHTVNYQVDEFKELLLPRNNNDSFDELHSLVSAIIEKQKQNLRYQYQCFEQKRIDGLICNYFLSTTNEIREIELWYCRRYPRLAEAQGLIKEVKDKYADHLARCERILSKPPSYWRSNPILQLIAAGESQTVEFKETLEWDVQQNQHNSHLNKECLRTIAAFLNTDGGTLLIGVSDSGEVKGLDRDLQHVRRNNLDGFEQKLRSLVRDRMNPSPTGNVNITFEELPEGTVCMVEVQRSRDVVHFDGDVYIRDGNGSRKLEGPDLTHWIQQSAR